MTSSISQGARAEAAGTLGSPVTHWLTVACAALLGAAVIVGFEATHSRLLVSWHGLLHAAIANRFPSGALPPENPFFAGQRLPYYWFYHFVVAAGSRLLRVDLVHTMAGISVTSLMVLVLAAGWIGRKAAASTLTGLAIAWLAVAGLNPLGAAIAIAKHLWSGAHLVSSVPETVETVFVSNRLADEYMTQPLLGAMHIGSDWRHGNNLVWYFDISSRAASLAMVVILLLVFVVPPSNRVIRFTAVTVASALLAALNPVMGLAVVLGMLGLELVLPQGSDGRGSRLANSGPYLMALVGVLCAAPTFYHLFLVGGGGTGLAGLRDMAIRGAALAANFLVLAPLAVVGASRYHGPERRMLIVTLATGLALLVAVVVVRLPEGNEHNLTNAAQCLLAVPAGMTVAPSVGSAARRLMGRAFVPGVFILFLPTALGTLYAYTSRPELPIGFDNGNVVRRPDGSPLARFYDWVVTQTSRNAVVIQNPAEPVKMSGNVAELPAFTSRTLFIDQPSYLTTPHKDASVRTRLASSLVAGAPLDAAQVELLRGLKRPLYVVSYHADQADVLNRLEAIHGSPVFHQGFVAAFALDLDRIGGNGRTSGR